MLVYKATNRINNKVYIGQTTKSLKERIRSHLKSSKRMSSKSIFHKAIRKYGIESFDWEILIECDNYIDLDLYELEAIVAYDAIENGYNLTLGGSGMHGYKHSNKTKIKISRSGKGRRLSAEARLNIKKGKINSYKDPEYREKHRQGAINRWSKLEQRINQAIIGGSKEFKMFDSNGVLVWQGVCKSICCKLYNLDSTCVFRCLEGRYKQHKGYTFKYA